MKIIGQCGICNQFNKEIVWLIRSRLMRLYNKKACLPCGIRMVRVKHLFVEEMPYPGENRLTTM